MNSSMDSTSSPLVEKKALVVIVVAVILAVAGFFYWKNSYTPPAKEAAPAEKNADLGSELYRQANNPVENKLPETAAPAPNPLQNIYKNPFE